MNTPRKDDDILNDCSEITAEDLGSDAATPPLKLGNREALELSTRLQLEVLLDIRRQLEWIYSDFPAEGFKNDR